MVTMVCTHAQAHLLSAFRICVFFFFVFPRPFVLRPTRIQPVRRSFPNWGRFHLHFPLPPPFLVCVLWYAVPLLIRCMFCFLCVYRCVRCMFQPVPWRLSATSNGPPSVLSTLHTSPVHRAATAVIRLGFENFGNARAFALKIENTPAGNSQLRALPETADGIAPRMPIANHTQRCMI